MLDEQRLLRISIFATVVVASFGIVLGLLSGSFSIAFDGVYSLGDAGMTALALWISSLIVRSAQHEKPFGKLHGRFTMGFWHLEPIVLLLNGTLLMGVAVYALINAVANILEGGHELRFDFAIIYAAITVVICLAMAWLEGRANRRLQSDFVALDVRAWIMSGGITLALLIAFITGYAVKGTTLDWVAPYVDPAVLALVCVIIIPLPIGTVRQALSDILLIAPAELKTHVDQVAAETIERHGFLSHRPMSRGSGARSRSRSTSSFRGDSARRRSGNGTKYATRWAGRAARKGMTAGSPSPSQAMSRGRNESDACLSHDLEFHRQVPPLVRQLSCHAKALSQRL